MRCLNSIVPFFVQFLHFHFVYHIIFRADGDTFFDADLAISDKTAADGNVESEASLEEEFDSDDEEFFDCPETFDVELEPTFTLPYSVAQESDPACVLMDKLIREGKLSRNSFYYKNFHEVAKHLENPKTKWDPEICEALMSIKHLGGKATMNHVIGPLSRGQGREGRKENIGTTGAQEQFNPVLNYGGPSSFTLQKYVPGIMPISGISKQIQLSSLRLLDLSDMKTVKPNLEIYSVALQMDGTMVRAGLSWNPKLGIAVGCQNPLTYQDLQANQFHLTGEFLKKNLVTEVDVCVLVSLCSKISLSLGYFLQPGSGKTGRQIIEKYSEIIKTVSKCDACVRLKPAHMNTISPEIPCSSYCEKCWSKGELCEKCTTIGRKTIFPQLEPCFQCLDRGITCKKVLVHVLALDCFTGNRFMIEKFQNELKDGTKDPEVYLTEPLGEIVHVLKTIKSSFSNWFLLGLCGNIFNLSMLRTLRDDNISKEVTAALKKVLQKGSVVNRDRQDTDCLIEFSKVVPVLRNVIEIDPYVVHQLCPEKFKIEPTNKPGSMGPIRFLGGVNIGHIAVVSDVEEGSKSFLNLLELHSPVRIKVKLELPHVIGFAVSECMVLVTTEAELMYIEVVKGTVIPKIPTKKDDLKELCRELSLSDEGTVKVLKSRLVKKLKPSTQLQPRLVKLDRELESHLNKNCILTKSGCKDSLVNGLLIADNDTKELLQVQLIYKGGEVLSKSLVSEYPHAVSDIKHLVTTVNVVILGSSSHLSILDSSLNPLAVVELETSLVDFCEIDNHVLITTPRTPQAYTPGAVTGVRARDGFQAYTKIIKETKYFLAVHHF